MERHGTRSAGSRLIRLTAVLLFTALLFGTVAGGTSAMKITTNSPVEVANLTPVTGVVVDPLPAAVPTDIPTDVPTDVAVVDAAPTKQVDTGIVEGAQTDVAADPGSTSGYNFLYFDLFRCPRGYANSGDIDPNQALIDCGARASNVSMHMTDGAGDHPQIASSSVSWSNVVTGAVTIKQDISFGQRAPFVFCRGVGGAFFPQIIENGAMTVSIVNNQEVYCAWFINLEVLPTDGTTAPIGNAVLTQGDNTASYPGSLYLNGGSACPVGFDSASASIYDLAFHCHDAAPATNYHVTSGLGTQNVSSATSASFSSVPAGDQTVWFDQPDGYGTPRVFCKSKNGDSEQEVQITNNSWLVSVQPDQYAYCDVIFIPAQSATGATTINDASFCWDNILAGDYSHANLANNCGTLNDLAITASVNGVQVVEADTSNGVAVFSNLTAGTVHFQGASPSVVALHTIVYCNISGIGDDHMVNVTGGSFDLDVTDGETVNCSWFFVAAGSPQTGGVVGVGSGSGGDGPIVTNCMPADATPASDDSSS